jgi:hypothetical protein
LIPLQTSASTRQISSNRECVPCTGLWTGFDEICRFYVAKGRAD